MVEMILASLLYLTQIIQLKQPILFANEESEKTIRSYWSLSDSRRCYPPKGKTDKIMYYCVYRNKSRSVGYTMYIRIEGKVYEVIINRTGFYQHADRFNRGK